MKPDTIKNWPSKVLRYHLSGAHIYDKPKAMKKSIQHLIFGDVLTPTKLAHGKGYNSGVVF